MDKRLQILQELYGEGDGPAARRLVEYDAALRDEYQRLGEAKRALDQQPRHRPDARVLDAILAAAAHESPPAKGRHADRPPAAPRAARMRAFGLVTAVLAVVMIGGSGLWQLLQEAPTPLAPVAAQQASPAVEDAAPADGHLAPQAFTAAAPAPPRGVWIPAGPHPCGGGEGRGGGPAGMG